MGQISVYASLVFLHLFSTYITADKPCMIGDTDFSTLNGPPWIEKKISGSNITTYSISPCTALGEQGGCPANTAVCLSDGKTGISVGNYTQSPEVTKLTSIGETLVRYYGQPWGDRPGEHWNTTINFKCGKTLGSPVVLESYDYDIQFEWYTTAACAKKITTANQEVRCYGFDAQGKKRDLTPLIKSKGGYEVDQGDGGKPLYINVCRDISPDGATASCGTNTSACLLDGTSSFSVGQPKDHLVVRDGKLTLTYTTSDTDHKPAGCTTNPQTTISFECPQRGQARGPRLLSSENCHYDILLETEYACPEETLVSNSCKLTSDLHGVNVDLTPLTAKTVKYHVDVPEKGTSRTYVYYLNVCGDATACSPGESACQKAKDSADFHKSLGKTDTQTLRYADRILTLTYKEGDRCSSHFKRTTVIQFKCNHTASDEGRGQPVFNREEACTYIFDWDTKYACLPIDLRCSVADGNRQFDLSTLTRTNQENWEAISSGQKPGEHYMVNMCHNLTNMGTAVGCPPGGAACHIGDKAVSLGRYQQSPTYDKNTQAIKIRYTGGSSCGSGKTIESLFTLKCSPGDLESGPTLVTSSECLYEFKWFTAAACVQKEVHGDHCKVQDEEAGLSFDLSPLTNTSADQAYYKLRVARTHHDYYINVCDRVRGSPCDDPKQNDSAVCQQDFHDPKVRKNAGNRNETLSYYNGILKLRYENGDLYSSKVPRTTEISFICNRTAGKGAPVFLDETDHTYSFKWETMYACPSVQVECTFTDDKTGQQYDLSQLILEDKNWVGEQKGDTNTKFYINVCRQAAPVAVGDGCDIFASACSTEFSDGKEKIKVGNLGETKTGPTKMADGRLVLHYTGGAACTDDSGKKTTYSTRIILSCPSGKDSVYKSPVYKELSNNCEYVFEWSTPAACPKNVEVTGDCILHDPSSPYSINLNPLRKKAPSGYYAVKVPGTPPVDFQINICGPVKGTCGADAGACQVNGVNYKYSNSNWNLVGNRQVDVTYTAGQLVESKGKFPKITVEIICNKTVVNATMEFSSKEDGDYTFRLATPIVCEPAPVECDFYSASGEHYDLSPLARTIGNWEITDTRFNQKHLKYYINICRPLNPVQNRSCEGGPVGGCQVDTNDGRTFNIGYILGQPVVVSTGVIMVKFANGTKCHAHDKDREAYRSTTITLTCSSEQYEPVFTSETDDCEYTFNWLTPAACPRRQVTGTQCTVEDPLYHHVFDLSTLRKVGDSDYTVSSGTGFDFSLNVCGGLQAPLKDTECEKTPGVGVCQKTSTDSINAGIYNKNLTYNDGVITLEYKQGRGNCHKKYERRSIITFICDYNTYGSNGPKYTNETDSCTYLFDWPTSLACNPFTIVDCTITGPDNQRYSLHSLTLTNDNYVVETPTPPKKIFVLNVCTGLVHKKGQTCPPGSAACMINPAEPDPQKRYHNVGSVSEHVLSIKNNNLQLTYSNGEPCEDGSGNSTVNILFNCKEDAKVSSPKYIHSVGCEHNFLWQTAAACPLKTPTDGGLGSCKVTNDVIGETYDLSPLKKSEGYTTSDKDGNSYKVSLCETLTGSQCQNAGVCVSNPAGTSHINGGQASSSLKVNPQSGMITITYENGDKCDETTRWSTVITFQCSATQQIIPEPGETGCVYRLVWKTPLVCRNRVGCSAIKGSDVVDLSPLAGEQFFTAIASSGSEPDVYTPSSAYLSVCHSLGTVPGTQCPVFAAGCIVEKGGKFKNIGHVHQPPQIDNKYGHVTLEYDHGGTCEVNATDTWETTIIFLCDKDAGKGKPQLEMIINCKYLFEWRTSVVCREEPPATKPARDCSYNDKQSAHIYNFTGLALPTSYQVKDFHLNMCTAVKGVAGCENAAVCKIVNGKAVSYGAPDQVTFVDEGNIKLAYHGGSKCPNGQYSSSSYILFSCSRHPPGEDFIHVEQEVDQCSVVFTWLTPLACPPVIRECVYSADGDTYDLSLLSRAHKSWQITDTHGEKYWLNLCRGIQDGPAGCGNDAAACRKLPGGDVEVLGEVSSQKIQKSEKGLLEVSYSEGSSACAHVVRRSDNSPASVVINFKCGNTIGTPKLVSRPTVAGNCQFVFEWTSRLACKEKRSTLKTPENNILSDPESGQKLDLTKITHRVVQSISTPSNQSAFKLNINGPIVPKVPGCEGAAVCMQKTDKSQNHSIGDFEKAKYFIDDGVLEIHYLSSTNCYRDPRRRGKASSVIDIHCSQDTSLRPVFTYETANCHYMFDWYSPEVCGLVHLNVHPDNGGPSASTGKSSVQVAGIVVALLASVLVLVLAVLVFRKQDFRESCMYRVRGLCRRRGYVSFRYSKLSSAEDEIDENFLSEVHPVEVSAHADISPGTPAITPYRDNGSDDELLL